MFSFFGFGMWMVDVDQFFSCKMVGSGIKGNNSVRI